MSHTVVAGLDGSPESLAAAEWAAREAERREAPLRLVHAWDWQPLSYAPLAGTEPQRHWAERVPREATEKLRRHHPDLEIGTEQVNKQPVDALLAAAGDAELLVLGSRSSRTTERHRLARCPPESGHDGHHDVGEAIPEEPWSPRPRP
ncbi:universal stress protein [Actinacidiphila soli]|uniref:universal stress protein n=1 Tax=Actinacidiphila soli TaxID=2487275 RepID=UPI000FCAA2DB|nr:universal stress protein [Actinacidiphila soli]